MNTRVKWSTLLPRKGSMSRRLQLLGLVLIAALLLGTDTETARADAGDSGAWCVFAGGPENCWVCDAVIDGCYSILCDNGIWLLCD